MRAFFSTLVRAGPSQSLGGHIWHDHGVAELVWPACECDGLSSLLQPADCEIELEKFLQSTGARESWAVSSDRVSSASSSLVACPVPPADVQRVVATVPLRKPRSAAWAVSSAAQAAEPPNTAALLGAWAGLFTGVFRQPEAEPLQLLTLNRPAPAVPGLSSMPAVASAAEQPAAAAAPQLLAGETTSRHFLALQDEMPSVEAVAAEEPSGIALSGPPGTATVAQLPPAQAQPSF